MFPNVASLATYGGPLNDYSAPRNSSTDRSASGTNPAYGDIAAMTHCGVRAYVRFVPHGTGSPTFAASSARDEGWNNGNNVAPVIARSSTGLYTATYPSTVFDEIPSSFNGSTPAGIALNLRAAWVNLELGSTTNYDANARVSSPNVITVAIYTVGTSTLVDPNDGTTLAVFAL